MFLTVLSPAAGEHEMVGKGRKSRKQNANKKRFALPFNIPYNLSTVAECSKL